MKNKLNEYFDNNLDKGTDLMTVWDVGAIYKRLFYSTQSFGGKKISRKDIRLN